MSSIGDVDEADGCGGGGGDDCQSVGSNVFRDFSDAWSQRFGQTCQLPEEWEQDVKANLDKHQHRVDQLRKELEKEEFYVQYLQQLLEDVDKHKLFANTFGNNELLDINDDNSKSETTTTTTSTPVDDVLVNSNSGDNNGVTKDDQYVTVITVSSYGQIQRSDLNSSNNNNNNRKPLIDNPLYQSSPLLTDRHNITSNDGNELLLANKKKRPPTPPRKPKVAKSDSINARKFDDNNLLHKHSSSSAKHKKNNTNNSSNNDDNDDKDTTSISDNSILYTDEPNIYDTVAPDEPTTTVHSEQSSSNDTADNLSNSYANYVNIDYFLRKEETSSRGDDSDDNETHISQSLSSDHDMDDNVVGVGGNNRLRDSHLIDTSGDTYDMQSMSSLDKNKESELQAPTYDEVFEGDIIADSGDKKVLSLDHLSDNQKNTIKSTDGDNKNMTMYHCIINNIIESETIYVDCLSTLIQYMKAMKSTLGTTHPLLTSEDLTTIFYKIPELHTIHNHFLEGLKKVMSKIGVNTNGCHPNPTGAAVGSNGQKTTMTANVGELFKVLASRLGAYSAFLKNYSKAIETIHNCSATNNQFSEITRSIKIMAMKGQSISLEELLHKPVARVQKNALVLHDLLKYSDHQIDEYRALKSALKMTQCFLNDLNIAATEQMFPVQDKTQRRLVKESFIVESTGGSDDRRKLRHLFLFNDVIVCAKYKPSTKQKFTFELKYYNVLNEITILDNDNQTNVDNKEISNNLLNIKSRVITTRHQIAREEEKEKGKVNTKLLEKLKKKRSDLEAHLVLYIPQQKFSISHKSGKIYTFYLSSDFERSQWSESIKVLQQSAQITKNIVESINFHELQAWVETCRKNLSANSLGSFLLRSPKDDDLLFGDLYLTVKHLKGLSREADIFFVLELDTYGHYLQRGVTQVCRQTIEPHFDQEFIMDLDGSQTLRILCYEEINGQQKPFFRGKAGLELSQTWLSSKQTEQMVPILDCVLTISARYVSSESQLSRLPVTKTCGAFGLAVAQVCRKEKTSIPYLISSCIREVERRGMKEVGIYRVSGLSSDIQKLRKAFETNAYEADLLIKDIDINAVTGILKLYLRELPESLFTNALYKDFIDAFNMANVSEKSKRLHSLFVLLAQPNQTIINHLIEHLYKVNQFEEHNKMSLHNLATVFGPTLIRPPGAGSSSSSTSGGTSMAAAAATSANVDSFTAGTIDVMAQAGILYYFLKKRTTNSISHETHL
ncbi:active breakpoint cluster region-related protein-like [Oppia nitens]|uniref:active breakpoint cluster region-related protein-like n=1 Tax=Oppia nitens TaxID=1686743 RepID=UPI0023DA52EC|nr:active breakpoint cluster region-related protein-like [Oppia nitens]